MLVMTVVPCFHASGQHGAHALGQQRVVTALRVVAVAQLRQCNGALGQAFKHQRVQRAAFGQVLRGIDAVARVAGA
jgi:hypothetical protein